MKNSMNASLSSTLITPVPVCANIYDTNIGAQLQGPGVFHLYRNCVPFQIILQCKIASASPKQQQRPLLSLLSLFSLLYESSPHLWIPSSPPLNNLIRTNCCLNHLSMLQYTLYNYQIRLGYFLWSKYNVLNATLTICYYQRIYISDRRDSTPLSLPYI